MDDRQARRVLARLRTLLAAGVSLARAGAQVGLTKSQAFHLAARHDLPRRRAATRCRLSRETRAQLAAAVDDRRSEAASVLESFRTIAQRLGVSSRTVERHAARQDRSGGQVRYRNLRRSRPCPTCGQAVLVWPCVACGAAALTRRGLRMSTTPLQTLIVFRDGLRLFAAATPTLIDDRLLAVVEWVCDHPEAIDWITRLVESGFSATAAPPDDVPAELADFAKDRKIDWATLLPILLQIAKLLL